MTQPDLPDIDSEWPAQTRAWWKAWGDDPRTVPCTETDWLFLLDGALLHATVWGAGEVARVNDLRAHMKAFEERLTALAATHPPERKATPLDELAGRRKDRKSGASRPARASGGMVTR